MVKDNEQTRIKVEAALAPLAYRPIDVTVDDDGIVYLNGTVRSGEERELAIRLAGGVEGVQKVSSNLEIAEVGSMDLERSGDSFQESDEEEVDLGSSVEPDFTEALGTTDVMESSSEAEPFFPPTDPVVFPIRREEGGIEVVGGFAPTSEDDVSEPRDYPPKVYQTDDELAGNVRRALARDASTASLDIRVLVYNGIVHLRGRVQSIEDAEQAESVAAEVPGVVEVREELEY
ncbi:MAG: BON domain-containing protein [Chloroflexi bacterium]|nr:BON domain-containing protein [Chloroflexota bacterium]